MCQVSYTVKKIRFFWKNILNQLMFYICMEVGCGMVYTSPQGHPFSPFPNPVEFLTGQVSRIKTIFPCLTCSWVKAYDSMLTSGM